MTVGQYETLRNRLDEILESNSSPDSKVERLLRLEMDILDSFSCRFALDLHDEIMGNVIQIDVDSTSIWGRLANGFR